MKYAVIVTYNFDGTTPVYLFDDYNKATEYLHDLWQEGYNTELAESFVGIDEENTYHEEGYAKITWADGGYCEYIVTCVREPITINGKDYR